jgi:hypothetical protein
MPGKRVHWLPAVFGLMIACASGVFWDNGIPLFSLLSNIVVPVLLGFIAKRVLWDHSWLAVVLLAASLATLADISNCAFYIPVVGIPFIMRDGETQLFMQVVFVFRMLCAVTAASCTHLICRYMRHES